jgi:hypothetical protein
MGVLKWFKDWKELNKRIARSFRKRDESIEKNKLDIAQIKGALAVLMAKSQSQISNSIKKSQSKIETKLIQKLRRTKKRAICEEIRKLVNAHSIIEIKNIIVDEKGLCSKASFYRYVSSLKSQKLIGTETKSKLKY